MRFIGSPATYSRTSAAFGVISNDRWRIAFPPGRRPGGGGNMVMGKVIGKMTKVSLPEKTFLMVKQTKGISGCQRGWT